MKKTMTRIAACSLAVLIAFNTVAIPKSKAVAFGSQFASAVTAAFMTATGFSMNVSGDWNGTSADMYIAERLDVFLRDFAEAREMTKAQFEELIYDGVEIVHGGLVKISSGVATLLGGFSDWLVDKLGLIGEDGTPVTEPVPLYSGVPKFDELMSEAYNSEALFLFRNNAYTPSSNLYEYYGIDSYFNFHLYSFIYDSLSNTLTIAPKEFTDIVRYYTVGYTSSSGWVRTCDDMFVRDSLVYDLDSYSIAYMSPCEIYDTNGNLCSLTDSGVSVSLAPDYEAPPKVEEQHSMVIDTGMSIEDEQAFVDSVLAGVAAGTLNPTYNIEIVNRDVVVPGEVTDTQAGILSWVKTIAQRVSALPQSIAEAVKGIFVPDAALTTEITNTFSEKFAFVPQLHALGTDLLNMGPDSGPPVIYIHLEDAEGTIDYGGTVKALDMSWYERYKEDGDRIIGGFLWLGFLWMLFKRAAAIIKGGEMVSEYGYDIDNGYRGSGRGGRHL